MLKVLLVLLAAQAHGRSAPATPADAEVLRALRPGMPNLPFFHETHRGDVMIVKTRLAAGRVPLPLPAGAGLTLDVSHWGCEVYYTEFTRSVYPFPIKLQARRVQTVYLDTVRLVP